LTPDTLDPYSGGRGGGAGMERGTERGRARNSEDAADGDNDIHAIHRSIERERARA